MADNFPAPTARQDLPATPLGIEPDQFDQAPVRVYCHTHGVCLYAGAEEPEGGAGQVWARAGCPPLDASGAELDSCPNRPA